MAVTFVIGRAGSGKTQRAVARMSAAARAEPLGPAIFWLVPKQATFSAERELTCTLGAFSRIQVVSFDQLAKLISQECGDAAVPEVTGLGRRLIIGHLLRQHQATLKFFGGVAHRPGLAAQLDATFAELDRAGRGPEELNTVLDMLGTGKRDDQADGFRNKLHDLITLYEAYIHYLGQERLDQHRRMESAFKQIESCELLRHATIYIDGFLEFTGHERGVIAALGRTCRAVEINLTFDPDHPLLDNPHQNPDDLSHFHRTERSYKELWHRLDNEKIKVTQPVRLYDLPRYRGTGLAEVAGRLFSRDVKAPRKVKQAARQAHEEPSLFSLPSAQPAEPSQPSANAGGTPAIMLIEAPDPRAEVDAVARQILELQRAGMRLRDIVVLVREASDWHNLIDASFHDHSIPYFMDRRRSATHHPLLSFVRSSLRIARANWRFADVMELLRSGLAGVTADEGDEVENYLLRHRLIDSPWDAAGEWRFSQVSHTDDDANPSATITPATPVPATPAQRPVAEIRREVATRLRPLIDRIHAGPRATVREWSTEIFGLIERFGVRTTVAGWIETTTEPEIRGEHEQAWAKLVDLFDQMVELLGHEEVTADGFVEILESGLDDFDFALTPPTVDQVLVGEVERTRTAYGRAVFVLGLNEGSFPPSAGESAILSRAERRELDRQKVSLDSNATRKQLDERLLAYIAFTRATEQLFVSRHRADEMGKTKAPSMFLNELRYVAPGLKESIVPPEQENDVSHIATPGRLLSCLMRWARTVADESSKKETSAAAGAGGCASSCNAPDSPLPALYQWLAGRPADGDAVERIRYSAWKALSYRNGSSLAPDIARRLFPSPLAATASQIETHAACPFKHFLSYGVRLDVKRRADLSVTEVSWVYHEVLDDILREATLRNLKLRELPLNQATALIKQFARNAADRLKNEVMLEAARHDYLLKRIELTVEQVIASIRAALARGTFDARHPAARFGDGARLPACSVRTPAGGEVRLSGKIDRIDVIAEGPSAGAVAVFDYKLGSAALNLTEVFHGLSLALLASLVAIESADLGPAGRRVRPAAAFYARLLRGLQKVDHPSEAKEPSSEEFQLRHKQRGVFDSHFIRDLDELAEPGKTSQVVAARIKVNGELGAGGDAKSSSDFSQVLSFVRGKIGQVADQIMAGVVAVDPYRLGTKSPCPQCDYRDVCRFEPKVDGYNNLESMKPQDVLAKIAGREIDDGE